MRLYEISQAIRELLDREELTDDQLNEVEALNLTFDDKVDGICAVMAELEGDADAIQAQTKRLDQRWARIGARIVRLKTYLKLCLEQAQLKAHKTKLWSVRIQASPPSARAVLPPEQLPEQFQRKKLEANAAEAIAYFKLTGTVPPGFEISTGSHLRVE